MYGKTQNDNVALKVGISSIFIGAALGATLAILSDSEKREQLKKQAKEIAHKINKIHVSISFDGLENTQLHSPTPAQEKEKTDLIA